MLIEHFQEYNTPLVITMKLIVIVGISIFIRYCEYRELVAILLIPFLLKDTLNQLLDVMTFNSTSRYEFGIAIVIQTTYLQ